MTAPLGRRRWLAVLLLLGGCCIDESPGLVTFSEEVETDLQRACRLSDHATMTDTAVHALANYLGNLTIRPSSQRLCTEHYATACQFEHPCDEPLDMSGPEPCPPKKSAPPRRYYVCFGCGVQTKLKGSALWFNGSDLDLLDRVVRESGARSREEALQRALRHYAELWLKKRKKPDFYQHSYNLPHGRKPDEPCRFR